MEKVKQKTEKPEKAEKSEKPKPEKLDILELQEMKIPELNKLLRHFSICVPQQDAVTEAIPLLKASIKPLLLEKYPAAEDLLTAKNKLCLMQKKRAPPGLASWKKTFAPSFITSAMRTSAWMSCRSARSRVRN
jgi:hypothetical protein